MLFATSFSDHVVFTLLAAWGLALLAAKLLKTIDHDGEVTKAAENGFADWLKRLFK